MRETILLVENDKWNAELMKRRLERHGYQVLEQHNGLEAKKFLEEIRPDLILMDLGLGGLDGWTLTSLLKADEQTRGIPIIAVTAHAMAGDRAKALDAGCDDYISKPVDFLQLFTAIERLLARSYHSLSKGGATNLA